MMKRYKEKVFGSIQESKDGIFVLHTEVLEMMMPTLQFVLNHREEIENGDGDFGDLALLLAMIK